MHPSLSSRLAGSGGAGATPPPPLAFGHTKRAHSSGAASSLAQQVLHRQLLRNIAGQGSPRGLPSPPAAAMLAGGGGELGAAATAAGALQAASPEVLPPNTLMGGGVFCAGHI